MGRDEGARKKEERPALVPKLRMINQILMVRFLNEIKIWHLIYILGFGIQPPPLSGAQKRKVFFFFFWCTLGGGDSPACVFARVQR